LDDTTKPLEIQLSRDISDKLENRFNVSNLLIIYFPVTIGPVLKFYLRKTNFTEMIAKEPDILGEITIIGKYAKAIKLRNGAIIYLRNLKIGNTLLMLIVETNSISKKVEEFLDILIHSISEAKELDPVKLADILGKLVNNIELD